MRQARNAGPAGSSRHGAVFAAAATRDVGRGDPPYEGRSDDPPEPEPTGSSQVTDRMAAAVLGGGAAHCVGFDDDRAARRGDAVGVAGGRCVACCSSCFRGFSSGVDRRGGGRGHSRFRHRGVAGHGNPPHDHSEPADPRGFQRACHRCCPQPPGPGRATDRRVRGAGGVPPCGPRGNVRRAMEPACGTLTCAPTWRSCWFPPRSCPTT